MIKNFLKIAIRSIARNKVNSTINIVGLTVGMAVFIMIMMYVQYQFSFDKFHENYEKIFKVERILKYSTGSIRTSVTPAPLGKAVEQNVREVTHCTTTGIAEAILISTSDNTKKFFEKRGLYADSTFFDIFTFPLEKGNPETALTEPLSIVLSKELANKYFPGQEAVGKILRLEKRHDCKVTGVLKEIPDNSYIKFNYLISFPSYRMMVQKRVIRKWNYNRFHTYVLLDKKESKDRVNQIIEDLPKVYMGLNNVNNLYLKPFSEIHLDSTQNSEGEGNSIVIINLLSIIALFTLITACINFMNLTTANSTVREKEVGIRKVIGSTRDTLIGQFLTESTVFAFISGILGVILVKILLPGFNNLVETEITISMLGKGTLLLQLLAVILLVGFLSGSYPAFYLSSFKPITVLRGTSKGEKNSFSRKILIMFQFIVSILLIIGSIIVYQQVNYLKTMDMGYNKENVLVKRMNNLRTENIDQYEIFKNELLKNSNIVSAAASDYLPVAISSSTSIKPEGEGENETIWFYDSHVDYDFLKTWKIQLVQGRNFSKQFSTDQKQSVVINETAVKAMGWANKPADFPIGKKFVAYGIKFTIIGVVRDFKFQGFQNIKPLMLRLHGGLLAKKLYFAIRITPGNISATKQYIREKFSIFFPEDLFDFQFFDDLSLIRRVFEVLSKVYALVGSLSLLVIFIAVLGLFAMASYSTRRRWKEIGIRKVYGASVSRILLLLSKEYVRIFAIANVVAWPLAYFILNKLLQEFPFRVSIQVWVFLLAGLISFVIGLITVSSQTLRAAQSNPVKTLRHE
jgi:putative ABC transport system permease protein